jgi:hypothetical protein
MSLTINKQGYVPWKGISTNSAVPIWSRPLINGPSATPIPDGNAFKARPIKHWRKQLNPDTTQSVGNSRSSVGILFDRPSSSVYLGVTTHCGDSCENSSKITELISNDKNLVFDNTKDASGKCVACNPERNIIKPATTVLSKTYYSNTNAYLKSRAQTYEQKLRTMPVSGTTYINNNDPTNPFPIPPSESSNGTQVWNTGDCLDFCGANTIATTIYKPNNQQFSQQGAVSSGSRLARLKYNTINKNGASFRNAYGAAAANAGKYHGSSDAPYFIKSKESGVCVPYRRNGKKISVC